MVETEADFDTMRSLNRVNKDNGGIDDGPEKDQTELNEVELDQEEKKKRCCPFGSFGELW